MIRSVERDKALRVVCSQEYLRGVINRDDVVIWRMHDEERFAQIGYRAVQGLLRDVIEELLFDLKCAAAEVNCRGPVRRLRL